MRYDELKQKIADSSKEDWLYNDPRGIRTYKYDLSITIRRKEIDPDRDRFSEEWVKVFPNPSAYRETYAIYYGASFVEEKMLVSVDEHRATLPLPDLKTKTVTAEDYHFAELVDFENSLDEYMERAGFEVE
jgi:hypothetical protein